MGATTACGADCGRCSCSRDGPARCSTPARRPRMSRPPERVLLFRSGRHLRVAIDALRAGSPGCAITVVATPAAATVLDQIGIDAAHRIIYDRSPLFRPWLFIT